MNVSASAAIRVLEGIRQRVGPSPGKLVFTQPRDVVLRLGAEFRSDPLIRPVLLGDPVAIRARANFLGLTLDGVECRPLTPRPEYQDACRSELRSRGVRDVEIQGYLRDPKVYAEAMLRARHASAVMCGPGPEETPLCTGAQEDRGIRFILLGSQNPAVGVALAAVSLASSVLSPLQLAETGAVVAAESEYLLGTTPELVFVAPGVPASLEPRLRFTSVRDDLENRLTRAIATLEARRPGLVVAGRVCFRPSDLADFAPGVSRAFVFTQRTERIVIGRALEAAWMLGPVLRKAQQTWGELSFQDSIKHALLTSRLTTLWAQYP